MKVDTLARAPLAPITSVGSRGQPQTDTTTVSWKLLSLERRLWALLEGESGLWLQFAV